MASLVFYNGAFWVIGLMLAYWLIKLIARVKLMLALQQGVRDYNVVRIEGLRMMPWTRDAVQQVLRQRSVHVPTTIDRVEVTAHVVKDSIKLVKAKTSDQVALHFKLQALTHAKIDVYFGVAYAAAQNVLTRFETPEDQAGDAQHAPARRATTTRSPSKVTPGDSKSPTYPIITELFRDDDCLFKTSRTCAAAAEQEVEILVKREWLIKVADGDQHSKVPVVVHVRPLQQHEVTRDMLSDIAHRQQQQRAASDSASATKFVESKVDAPPSTIPLKAFSVSELLLASLSEASAPPAPASGVATLAHLDGALDAALSRVRFDRLVVHSADAILDSQELFGMEEVDCTVCLSEPKDIVLLPCRHVCICHACHQNVQKCPVCRAQIQNYLRFDEMALTAAAAVGGKSPVTSPVKATAGR